ncbi:hypothetical protein Hanom_Chr13g01243591 [Helianthus anomalus]
MYDTHYRPNKFMILSRFKIIVLQTVQNYVFTPLKNKFTLLLPSKNFNFALGLNYDFAQFDFTVLPLCFFSLKYRFCHLFKIMFLPPLKNKFTLLFPAKIFNFTLGSKLRFYSF